MEKRGHMGDFYRNLMRSNVAFGSSRCVGIARRKGGLLCSWQGATCQLEQLINAKSSHRPFRQQQLCTGANNQ